MTRPVLRIEEPPLRPRRAGQVAYPSSSNHEARERQKRYDQDHHHDMTAFLKELQDTVREFLNTVRNLELEASSNPSPALDRLRTRINRFRETTTQLRDSEQRITDLVRNVADLRSRSILKECYYVPLQSMLQTIERSAARLLEIGLVSGFPEKHLDMIKAHSEMALHSIEARAYGDHFDKFLFSNPFQNESQAKAAYERAMEQWIVVKNQQNLSNEEIDHIIEQALEKDALRVQFALESQLRSGPEYIASNLAAGIRTCSQSRLELTNKIMELILLSVFDLTRPQWQIWMNKFPVSEPDKHETGHFLNGSLVYWWRHNVAGLPEGVKILQTSGHSAHVGYDIVRYGKLISETHVRLMLAVALDPRYLDYTLLDRLRIFFASSISTRESFSEAFPGPVYHRGLVLGLAMALGSKMKHFITENKQLGILEALTILRGIQLTKCIRQATQLQWELDKLFLRIQPLLQDANKQSLVLHAIHKSIDRRSFRNPGIILRTLINRHNIPHVELDQGNVILLGDALGFVCLTAPKVVNTSHIRWSDSRIVLLKDKIKICRNPTTFAHGFRITNVHEHYEPEYVTYCWETGPWEDRQKEIALMIMGA